MSRFDLFILRPCGADTTTQRWQVTHRQSGEQAIVSDTATATAWLADKAGTGSAQQPAASPAGVRWAAGAAIALRLAPDMAHDGHHAH